MTTVGKSLQDSGVRFRESFFNAIKEGLTPFNLGEFTVAVGEDWDLLSNLQRVDIWFKDYPELNIEWYLRPDDLMGVYHDTVWHSDLGQRIVEFYRARPLTLCGDHIELGEN